MRVTHRIIANTVIKNINANLTRMNRYQNMLSSGKVISKPSDDPVKISRIMGYTTELQQNKQYQRNIDAAQSWLESTENALAGINDVLQRARELAVSGADGTKPQEARDAIAMEVDELIDVLLQLANTSVGGRYIFAGYKTTSLPFTRDKFQPLPADRVAYHGDSGALRWEIAPGVTVKGNIDGQTLFMDTGIFTHMEELIDALRNNNDGEINTALDNLSKSIDDI
ncbi:MAG: flagellar hook-associated protein FlgL, partial [Firmicutes bacterium]|nr:flagellar hook-associated protein FlgL [Bacillota bacterium]